MRIPRSIEGLSVLAYAVVEDGWEGPRVRLAPSDVAKTTADALEAGTDVMDVLETLAHAGDPLERQRAAALALVRADDLFAVYELDSSGLPIDDEWWFTTLESAQEFGEDLEWRTP